MQSTDDLVKRLLELAARYDEAAERIEKLEPELREIIRALNDPKGGQHVYDMRNASYIARKALEGKDGT